MVVAAMVAALLMPTAFHALPPYTTANAMTVPHRHPPFTAAHATMVPRRHPPPSCGVGIRSRLIRRLSDRVYNETVVPGSGGAQPSECYAMVLLLYIQLNHYAWVEPPSRPLIERVFSEADLNSDGTLNRGEFRRLVTIVAMGAVARVLGAVVVNTLIAPLFALLLVGRLVQLRWWAAVSNRLVALLGPWVGEASFLRAAVAFAFAYTLGSQLMLFLYDQVDRAVRLKPALVHTKAYRRMRRMQLGHYHRVHEALARTPAFAELTEAQRVELNRAMRLRIVERGEYVFRQGERADRFYVIVDGGCEVRRADTTSIRGAPPSDASAPSDGTRVAERVLARLDVGACFGERALRQDEARYASVVALSRLTLMGLEREDFERCVGERRLDEFIRGEEFANRV